MKKIVSFMLACILVFSPFLQVSANSILDEKKIAVKNILVTKNDLKKISNWEKYVLAMDSFVEKVKNNSVKVDTVKTKIDKAIYGLEWKQWSWKILSPKERQLITILKYLQARLDFVQLDNIQKQQEAEENKFKEILEESQNPTINDLDRKEIEKAIISIQKNLLEKSQQNIESILWDFEDYFNYESKGDFEMNFKSDHESIWSINAELKLSDYVTQASSFDSRFKGHISAVIDALPKWEDAVKAEMSSFIDFISKDGQIYALAKDLNITTEENLDHFQDVLDTLKKLAKENKYIEISDEQTAEVMKIIKTFNPDVLFNDAQQLFSKPMFTAYKKEGEKFHIIPTKYACDSLKVLANKFDPFSPNNCTDSQYNEVIKDLLTQWELTMTLGKENVIQYSQYKNNNIDTLDITTSFTNDSITKINILLLPNQDDYKNEKFTLDYEKNKQLDITLYADNGDVDVKLESTLDSRNNFSSLHHTGYIKNWNDDIVWNLNIKNRKIEWKFKAKSPKRKYNYETGEYEDLGHEYFEINLQGNTDSRNEVKSISIDYVWNDGENDILTGEMTYNLPKLKFVSTYKDSFGKADINFEGEWNTRNDNFDSFDAQVEVSEKERTFDYETYTYKYSWEQQKVFDLDYSLENTEVKGTLNAYDNNKVIFWIISNGTYKKDQLELNNEIVADFVNTFFRQTEKARDSVRISDIKMMQTAIEMHYQDNAEYPSIETLQDSLSAYLATIPTDPSGNIELNGCQFGYKYEVWADIYWIENQVYNLSTCFESENNSSKSQYDNWKYNNRFEVWSAINNEMKESIYVHGYTTWTKQEVKEESTPIINVNFEYDYSSNKTNSELYIDAIYEEQKVFEMNMKNIGNIEYKQVDIQAPSDTVPMKEVFKNNYYY